MDILEFRGETKWLSNYHLSDVVFEGVTYPAIENAFQAAKTEPALREPFKSCTPAESKKLGRSVPLRSDWEHIKLNVMRTCIQSKFAAGTELAEKLKATAPGQLVEGNTWNDVFWGVCNGQGHNNLGKLLMEQRAALLAK